MKSNENEILINRPDYINKLCSWLGQNDLVKIITGTRRSGKSKLFTLFQNKLIKDKIASKKQIININLEDLIQIREIGLEYDKNNFLTDYNKLLDYILAKLDNNKLNYIFIDEIQLLKDWQILANTLRLQNNIDLYLTGSNAYMFSGDLANIFGGRYVEIKIQPFSFKEFCSVYSVNGYEDLINLYQKYIKESGFPQTIKFNSDRELINDYLLNTVYLNTIQKDIIKRYNIADSNKLDSVIRYIFDNIGNETSLRGISNRLKTSGIKASVPTIDSYLKGLLDSYLVYKCDRYDIKGKRFLDCNSKYYVADIGLRTALLGKEFEDFGHILENVVYLELLRRNYRVSVGRVNSKIIKNNNKSERKNIEVDFIAQKNGKIEYYQVALYTLEKEVLKREIASLEEIRDNYPKYLLTMDFGSNEINGIQRINVLDWLYNKQNLS